LNADQSVTEGGEGGFVGRLRSLMRPKETESAFAARLVQPLPTVRKWLAGKTQPRGKTLAAIATKLGVTAEWLASEEGANVAVLRPDLVFVPRYEFRVSAGGGAWPDDEQVLDSMAFQREWVRHKLGRDPARLMLTEARGSSMEPTIESGDMLLVDLGDRGLVYEQPVVARLDGVLVVKRIWSAGRDAIRVRGDAEGEQGGEVIPRDQVDDRLHIIGRVRWIARLLA
jgi:phage repressor protein C with HTH and peptisase S24 domain